MSNAEGGPKPYSRLRTAASIGFEALAPTVASELSRARRGSALSMTPEESGNNSKLQGIGVVVGIFESPTIGGALYGIGKAAEFIVLAQQKTAQIREQRRSK